VNGPNNPAEKGSTISIYATGEGPLNPAGVDGQLENGPGFPMPAFRPTATINNLPAQIMYAGTVGSSFDGFFQVNAVIPPGVASGTVPVIVTVGTMSSPPVNVVVK
jgi:uncharacterized protein (TIGR03437 family)